MNKISILTLALAFGFVSVYGQEKKTVSKSVEVVKQYSPKIGSAIKQDITPDEVTKIVLEAPKFNYSIAYKPEPYMPRINTLESFRVSTHDIRQVNKGYAHLSVGYPLQSKANFAYTTNPAKNLFVAGGFNHYGFWGKLENDLAQKLDASETQNSVFAMIDYRKNRFLINGGVAYSYDMFDKYGFKTVEIVPNTELAVPTNKHQKVEFDVNAGTPYTMGKLWDGKFYTNATYFNSNDGTARKFSETLITLGTEVSKGFTDGRHRAYVGLGYSYYKGKLNHEIVEDIFRNTASTLSVLPKYRYLGKKGEFNAQLGFVVEFNNFMENKATTVKPLPQLSYSYKTKHITMFAGIRSQYIYNTNENLTAINPYIVSGHTAANTTTGDAYLGLDATIGKWFSIKAEGGATYSDKMIYFYNMNLGNEFGVRIADKLLFGFANISASAMLMDKLIANIDYRFRSVDLYTYAKHEMDFNLKYTISPKFFAKAKASLMSSRKMLSIYGANGTISEENIPTKLNLGLGAEYMINRVFSVTLDLDNILNSDLYKFNSYKGMGISVMAGVSAKF